jgi:hypothetical protein
VIQLPYDAGEIIKEAVVALKDLLEADGLVNRQLRQGRAYLSYRGLPAATWLVLQKGTETLLGLWARLTVAAPCTSPYLWVSFISMRRLRRFPISS